jgi:hypothetical protein
VRLERTNVKGQHPRKIVRLLSSYKSVTLIDLGTALGNSGGQGPGSGIRANNEVLPDPRPRPLVPN